VLLPKRHPLSKKKAIARSDLASENTVLLGEGHCFRDQVLSSCPDCLAGSQVQQSFQGTSLETIRHMVASGMGITILPSTATQITQYARTLCVKPFSTPVPKRTVALAWRASFPRTLAIDALIEALATARITSISPL
jgi:LysR family transcriptional regulator, hydrogen peroxide-inducible genes activator